MGGFWGVIATGIFAAAAINGASGLIEGNFDLFAKQVLAAVVVMLYSVGVTYILAKVIDGTIGLRVKEEEEYVGLDLSQHGERAFT
jgi:Amt family ammonium transporter